MLTVSTGQASAGNAIRWIKSSDLAVRDYNAAAETNNNTDQVETRSHFSTDLMVEMRLPISC